MFILRYSGMLSTFKCRQESNGGKQKKNARKYSVEPFGLTFQILESLAHTIECRHTRIAMAIPVIKLICGIRLILISL